MLGHIVINNHIARSIWCYKGLAEFEQLDENLLNDGVHPNGSGLRKLYRSYMYGGGVFFVLYICIDMLLFYIM